MTEQFAFFDAPPAAPPGFRYRSELLSADIEGHLLAEFERLPFEPFQFHQYTGNRRIVSFGWKYDYVARTNYPVDPIPEFLLPVREAAAAFADLRAAQLQQALVTEYSPGTAIGWHRDKAVYGEIVGISLLAPCTFRLRRKRGTSWDRFNLTAAPRSVYLLSGAARTEWEHSIPPVESLRYSITFRNLASR
jgi:alkylated DNA repair dioxygenase AlkB